ncbi:hypothetical protein [Rubritalea tangerina]|uniref:hypothetical protein n=1 Tax=Rubritalea tangerina TaxID=430798 RepID=UPI003606C4F3
MCFTFYQIYPQLACSTIYFSAGETAEKFDRFPKFKNFLTLSIGCAFGTLELHHRELNEHSS